MLYKICMYLVELLDFQVTMEMLMNIGKIMWAVDIKHMKNFTCN